jgi:hypothetical protein
LTRATNWELRESGGAENNYVLLAECRRRDEIVVVVTIRLLPLLLSLPSIRLPDASALDIAEMGREVGQMGHLEMESQKNWGMA